MRLQLQNVGKITNADLKLDGITVIAGNNTGKSTVGKTMFALFNALYRIEHKLNNQKEQLIVQMMQRKIEDLPGHQDGYYLGRIPNRTMQMWARDIVNETELEEQKKSYDSFLNDATSKIMKRSVPRLWRNPIESKAFRKRD